MKNQNRRGQIGFFRCFFNRILCSLKNIRFQFVFGCILLIVYTLNEFSVRQGAVFLNKEGTEEKRDDTSSKPKKERNVSSECIILDIKSRSPPALKGSKKEKGTSKMFSRLCSFDFPIHAPPKEGYLDGIDYYQFRPQAAEREACFLQCMQTHHALIAKMDLASKLLIESASMGLPTVTEYLMGFSDVGVDRRAIGERGLNAVQEAISGGFAEVVAILTGGDPDYSVDDVDGGRTVRDYVTMTGSPIMSIDAKTVLGVDVEDQNVRNLLMLRQDERRRLSSQSPPHDSVVHEEEQTLSWKEFSNKFHHEKDWMAIARSLQSKKGRTVKKEKERVEVSGDDKLDQLQVINDTMNSTVSKTIGRDEKRETEVTEVEDLKEFYSGWNEHTNFPVDERCDVDEIHGDLTQKDFIEKYYVTGRPFILRAHVPAEEIANFAKARWDTTSRFHSNTTVSVGPTAYPSITGQSHCSSLLKISEIENATECVDQKYKGIPMVHAHHPQKKEFKELFPQYHGNMYDPKGGWRSIRQWFGLYALPADKGCQIFFGGDGSGATIHWHAAAVNLLYVGVKEWRISPPQYRGLSGAPARKASAMMNPLHTLQCVQRAGDTLFIPDNWGHLTINHGFTIGMATILSPKSQGREVSKYLGKRNTRG